MMNNVNVDKVNKSIIQSYKGLLSYGNTYKLKKDILDIEGIDDIL